MEDLHVRVRNSTARVPFPVSQQPETSRMSNEPKCLRVRIAGEWFTVSAGQPDTEYFWRGVDSGEWEDGTLRFVREHAAPEATFVDIGAWSGPVALYASRHAGRVVALEPDPVARAELERNARLNRAPIEIWDAAIDIEAGALELFAPDGLGKSVTSAIPSTGAVAMQVRTVTMDRISAAIAPNCPVVLKVDIEGHEYRVIEDLVAFSRRHRAPIHLSLHVRAHLRNQARHCGPIRARLATLRDTAALVRKLHELGEVTLSSTGRPLTVPRFLGLMVHKLALRRWPAPGFSLAVVPRPRN